MPHRMGHTSVLGQLGQGVPSRKNRISSAELKSLRSSRSTARACAKCVEHALFSDWPRRLLKSMPTPGLFRSATEHLSVPPGPAGVDESSFRLAPSPPELEQVGLPGDGLEQSVPGSGGRQLAALPFQLCQLRSGHNPWPTPGPAPPSLAPNGGESLVPKVGLEPTTPRL